MADFSVAVETWVQRVRDRQTQAFIGIAEAVRARVMELTPVLTGRLRAGWFLVARSDDVEGQAKDINQFEIGDVIVLSNNVEYARRIEYGFVGEDSRGRKYMQQPRGMVAQTVTEIPAIADAVVKRLTGR